MITVENDYEPIIFEQPFSSHIYENQLEVGPIKNNPQITQEVNEFNTVIKPDKKTKYNARIQIIFIKTYKKNNQERKFGKFHFF